MVRRAGTKLNAAQDGGRSISAQHWSRAPVLKEPSTPGNELPAWWISLTGRDCCGATWYCNSSNSLTSHFSSITLPWPAKESFTRTYRDCLSACQQALESNCHVAAAAAAAHPAPSPAYSIILTWFNVTAADVFPFFRFKPHRLLSVLFAYTFCCRHYYAYFFAFCSIWWTSM